MNEMKVAPTIGTALGMGSSEVNGPNREDEIPLEVEPENGASPHRKNPSEATSEAKSTLDGSSLSEQEPTLSVQEDDPTSTSRRRLTEGSNDSSEHLPDVKSAETNGAHRTRTSASFPPDIEKPSSVLLADDSLNANGLAPVRGQSQQSSTPPGQSSTGSPTASETEQENKTKPNTRSRGSGKKPASSKPKQRDSGNRNEGRIVVDRSSSARGVNEAATLLSRADDESYERAILQDASYILERILFPMCFPWNHSIVPANRNFPKDIDELPAILQADIEESTPFDNGVFGYGGFEVAKERSPSDGAIARGGIYRAATRRTNDVGVIELTMIDNDSVIDKSSRLRKRKHHHAQRDEVKSSTAGAAVKETRKPLSRPTDVTDTSSKTARSLSDSRPSQNGSSSTHDDVEMMEARGDESIVSHEVPTFATDVVLPAFECARASKKQRILTSNDKAHRLSVSVRFGSVSSRSSILGDSAAISEEDPLFTEATLPSRRNRNDVYDYNGREINPDRAKWLKRDNLSWTQSSVGGYESKLSYTTLPSSISKKPRNVRVGVRIDGHLLTSVQPETERVLVVQARGPIEASMCMLDCDKLMETCVKRPIIRDSFPWKPPRLDCIPPALCGGSIRVACTSLGTMKRMNVQNLFRKAGQQPTCTVCFSSEGDVLQCSMCGTQVHTACCANGGAHFPSTNGDPQRVLWRCAVCSFGPRPRQPRTSPSPRRRPTNLPSRYQSNVLLGIGLHAAAREAGVFTDEALKCTLCPHSGGAMSPNEEGRADGWSHEVCRIWAQGGVAYDATMPKIMGRCALCGQEDGSLVRCAGSGCTVRFHAMCALIAIAEDEKRNLVIPWDTGGETKRQRDQRLCRRFTLDILECDDTDSGNPVMMPVGFCSLHNRERDRFLYGCYPGGMAVMRVPPYKNARDDEQDDSHAQSAKEA